MSIFIVKILIRLLVVICCGFILSSVALFLVKRYLPGNQELKRDLRFSLPESLPENAAARTETWRNFAHRQEQILLNIAEQTIPELTSYCSVKGRSDEPLITFSLRCPRDINTKVGAGFHEVIDAYINRRVTVERNLEHKTTDLSHKQTPNDWLVYDELQKLRRIYRAYTQKKQEHTLLDIEYHHLKIQNLDLKDQLVRDTAQQPRGAFADFLQPRLETAYAADNPLKQALASLSNARRKIYDINFRLERGQNGDRSAFLAQQREELEQRCRILEREIRLRRQLLTDRVKSGLWPKFKIRLRQRIRANQKLLKENRARQGSIEADLKKLDEQIAAIRPSFLQDVEPNQIGMLAELLPTSAPLPAQLDLNLVDFSKSYLLSLTQKFILTVVALTGGLIGFLIPLSLPQRRKMDIHEPVLPPVEVEVPELPEEDIPKTDEQPPPPPDEASQDSSEISQEKATPQVLTINLERDHPLTASAAENGYSEFIRRTEQLRDNLSYPVILLGASGGQEGAARCVVNLAIALTGAGRRVLLVEADQTARDLAAVFELPEAPGFFEWRRGEAWISHSTHKTQLVGLTVMPAGTPSEDQLQPDLDLTREIHRWANLSNQFDVILLYSPATLAVKVQSVIRTVTEQLLNMADAFFLLTRAQKKGPEAYAALSKRAEEAVSDHKAEFQGIIALEG